MTPRLTCHLLAFNACCGHSDPLIRNIKIATIIKHIIRLDGNNMKKALERVKKFEAIII